MMQQAMMQPVQQQEQQQQPEDVGYSSGEEAQIKEDRKVISRAYKQLGGKLGVTRSSRNKFIEDSQLRIQKEGGHPNSEIDLSRLETASGVSGNIL